MIGETLGHYRILGKLGVGGMGEVFRADDTRLGREVAVKVLPASFPTGPEAVARLEREARALAAVEHPHIASIYSFETVEVTGPHRTTRSIRFLVMQLVRGETLARRIARGPLAVAETTAVAGQVAVALEAAHERGIIHRDLKPANIMVDDDGHVTVLDFGLAKLLGPHGRAGGPRPMSQVPELSQAPTMGPDLTREGALLGTVAYMSPEQARGQPADRRSDVWAFGCLLYEMLTGRRAFAGETLSDQLAQILEREPAWEALPDTVPATLRTLIRRCLAKEPRERFHHLADIRLWLDEVPAVEAAARSAADPDPRRQWRHWGMLAGVAAVVGALAVWGVIKPAEKQRVEPVARFVLPSPPLALFTWTVQVAISRDGGTLAYVVGEGGQGQIYLRRLDTPEPIAVAGAERASSPFFSPDGAWLGFHADQKLERVPVEGGKSWTIAASRGPTGATWGPDGTIVYGNELASGLFQVSSNGGEAQRLTTVDRSVGEYAHVTPQFLPGGDAVLFTVIADTGRPMKACVLDLQTGARTDLLATEGSQVRHLHSGHLAYAREGSLMVLPFDLPSRTAGPHPATVFDGLFIGLNGDGSGFPAHFSASDGGTLVYVAGPPVRGRMRLVEVDRTGRVSPLGFEAERILGPRFSRDAQRVAVTARLEGKPNQVGVYDLTRGIFTKVATEGEGWWPAWSPDGRSIVFPGRTDPKEPVNLILVAADGSGSPERLTRSELSEQPTTWTPDGHTLIYHRNDDPETAWDLMAIDLSAGTEPRVLLATPFNEILADLSPDGRWLAYASDESGRLEVYVRPYPGLGRKWQISTDGGLEPAWSPDGRELFYRDQTGRRMMVVPMAAGQELAPGRPQLLFEGSFVPSPWFGRVFDVAPDGQRFVLVQEVLPEGAVIELRVVVNWFAELEERVAADPE